MSIIFIAYTLKGLSALGSRLIAIPPLGIYVGHHLNTRIDQKRFNQVISFLLMVGGIMQIIKTSIALFE